MQLSNQGDNQDSKPQFRTTPKQEIIPENPAEQPIIQYESPTTPQPQTPSLEDRQKSLNKSKFKNSLKSGIGFIGFFVTAFIFALVINRYVLQSYQVIGSSMSPTLEEDDWLVISKLGKTAGNAFGEFTPSRGDIIVFSHPKAGEDKSLIKRVIALPGESIELSEDGFRVFNNENPNGIDPDSEYRDFIYTPDTGNIESFAPALADGPITVPDGEVFVVGDNRAPGRSLDSRGSLGTVPVENITGVLKARLFPFGDLDFTF